MAPLKKEMPSLELMSAVYEAYHWDRTGSIGGVWVPKNARFGGPLKGVVPLKMPSLKLRYAVDEAPVQHQHQDFTTETERLPKDLNFNFFLF